MRACHAVQLRLEPTAFYDVEDTTAKVRPSLLFSHTVYFGCVLHCVAPGRVFVPCRLQNRERALNFPEGDVLRLLRALAAIIENPDAGVCAGPGSNVSLV